jgi:hypothetical protein
MRTSCSRSRPHLPVSIGLLLGVFAFLLWVAGTVHLHHDEELKYRFTSGALFASLRYVAEQDVFPPLWFTVFWLWNSAAGVSEFTGRFLSVSFSMVTLALVIRLGRAWLGGWRDGWLAAMLLCTGALFAYHSVEVSPYALGMLLAAGSMGAFAAWLRTRRRTWALVWGLLAAAMLYTHYYLGFVLLAQAAYLLFCLLRRRRMPPVRQFVIGAGVFAVLWGPWLPVMLHQVASLRRATSAAGQAWGTQLGSAYNQIFTSGESVLALANTATSGLWPAYIVLIGLALWRARRGALTGLLLAWALGIPLISLALNFVMAVYAPRYVATATVGLALLASVGLLTLPRRIGITAGLLLAGAQAVLVMTWLPSPHRIPYRDIYQEMRTHLQPGDVIAYVDAAPEDRVATWNEAQYLRASNVRLTDPDMSALADYRRIWFMTGRLLDADVQAQFRALEATHPVELALGDCVRTWCYVAQLMQAPPLETPLVFGDVLLFYGADVSVQDGALHTRVYWRADAPPVLDYSIGVHVLDAQGTLVAQSDGPIVHFGQPVQTSAMQPGVIYQDRRTIPLPPGLPAGCCEARLIVYQSWDGARLVTPDGADFVRLITGIP